MLEPPDLNEGELLGQLAEEFGLFAAGLVFLPLGADVNTAVYRVELTNGRACFLKLRKGSFAEVAVSVPHWLGGLGLREIISPLETRRGQLWASLGEYRLILYPYVEGVNGYQQALTPAQWRAFGAALRAIHSTAVPAELARQLPVEDFNPAWRTAVRAYQQRARQGGFTEPAAARLVAILREREAQISRMLARADALGLALAERPPAFGLCHSDIHPGNLLLGPAGELYLVDWDNPTLSPKERDLNLVGGCATWHSARQTSLFYEGYGPAQIDAAALAYYRYQRVLEDIAAFSAQLLDTNEGGRDRERSLQFFNSLFTPGGEVEQAFRADGQEKQPGHSP